MRSRIARVLGASLREFTRRHGFTRAAALSFYALVAFIPLVFLAVSAAGVIAGETETARSFIAQQLELVLPWYKDLVMSRLSGLALLASNLGLHSVAFMFWTSGLFFFELQQSLLADWPSPAGARRGAAAWRWYRRAFPWIAGPAFAVILLLFMAVAQVLSYLPGELLPEAASGYLALSPLLVSFAGLALMFLLMYLFILPVRRRLPVAVSVAAGLSAASHVITLVFSRALTGLPNYNAFYGSLSGTILFLFWLEWNMSLFIAGGHFLRLWPGDALETLDRSP
ncbi:MAG: YihY/virulence factor BrkB family protein [Desulfovibrionaceae bacterium]|nr:YihY/virulence factor BrkB family protein [Desulfovibrionaceae bacterium]MBF0513812.1 YihY/virulence factor BrkB family protein [Desulfovibrionaceae bacterium]